MRVRPLRERRPQQHTALSLEVRKGRILETFKTSCPLPFRRLGHEPSLKEGLRDKSRTNLTTTHLKYNLFSPRVVPSCLTSCRDSPQPGSGLRGQGLQGYVAHKKNIPTQDPTVGLCLGSYGGPRGVSFFYRRSTLAGFGVKSCKDPWIGDPFRITYLQGLKGGIKPLPPYWTLRAGRQMQCYSEKGVQTAMARGRSTLSTR